MTETRLTNKSTSLMNLQNAKQDGNVTNVTCIMKGKQRENF